MSSKEERKISDVKLQTQQYRLNEAAALFKACMSNMSQILNCKSDDDDSETAEADSLLRIVREYVTTRLQPKTGRIILPRQQFLTGLETVLNENICYT